jgi:hypothetical protein
MSVRFLILMMSIINAPLTHLLQVVAAAAAAGWFV